MPFLPIFFPWVDSDSDVSSEKSIFDKEVSAEEMQEALR